jgi:GNAT superfamily N-acetyltransferase
MITFSTEVLSGYEEVKWADSSKKPLIIHRLFVHPNWRKQGITDHLLTFAEEYAKDQGYTSLRLHVYGENQEAISVYNNFHYQQTGQIQLKAQKVPFYCFEKTF